MDKNYDLITIGEIGINLANVTDWEPSGETSIDVLFNVAQSSEYEGARSVRRLYFEDAKAFLWYWDQRGVDVKALWEAEQDRIHRLEPSGAEKQAMLDGSWTEKYGGEM